MSLAEFSAACGGFEDFHAAPDNRDTSNFPSPEAHYRAMGLTPPQG